MLVALALIAGCERRAHELRLIAPRTVIDERIATELAKVFDEESSVRIVLVENSDQDRTALEALAAGDGDIALVSNLEPFHTDVETVIPLYPTVLHIMRKKGSDVMDPAHQWDPALTVLGGPVGAPSRALLETYVGSRYNLSRNDIMYVDSIEASPDLIIAFTPILPRQFKKFQIPDEYEMVSLLESPDDIGRGTVVDAASLLNPSLRPFVIPATTYDRFTPEPVVTLAVDKLIVTRSRVPEATIYDFVRELLRHKAVLSALHPGLFRALSDQFDASQSTFIVHRGSQAFARRDEPNIYERYSGIAEVAVTIFLALLSGAYAMVRVYRIRRKNRIDTFYKEAIALRNVVDERASLDARNEVIEKLRDLQAHAFELLVDEKLAADESFRIFITLSNDMMAEIRDLARS